MQLVCYLYPVKTYVERLGAIPQCNGWASFRHFRRESWVKNHYCFFRG